jgi:hypothetical protein
MQKIIRTDGRTDGQMVGPPGVGTHIRIKLFTDHLHDVLLVKQSGEL